MKIKSEVLVKHPWWHYPFVNVHKKTHGIVKDPDTGEDSVCYTEDFTCHVENCKYHKVTTKMWIKGYGD